MATKDPRVDAYIRKSAEFARPILTHLRAVIHETCPDAVETVKWSSPSYEYHGILCGMAAFKAHCAFGFWKHDLVVESQSGKEREAMGSFGRITSMSDLPSKATLVRYIKKAMQLNEDGVKVPARSKDKAPRPVDIPDDLARALQANPKAEAVFAKFPPSHKREYVEWITSAKTEATRSRRLETALAWMAEGKPRNWKYMNC